MYQYEGVVFEVTDGDTIKVELDLGLRTYRKVSLRLEGLNAPEMNTPEGKASRAALLGLLPPGTKVRVDTIKDKKTFDRYRAYVHKTDPMEDVNRWLIDNGWAVRATYD